MENKGEDVEKVIFECIVKFDTANILEYYFSFVDNFGTPSLFKCAKGHLREKFVMIKEEKTGSLQHMKQQKHTQI